MFNKLTRKRGAVDRRDGAATPRDTTSIIQSADNDRGRPLSWIAAPCRDLVSLGCLGRCSRRLISLQEMGE